jgi:hypothetical protein
VDPEDAVIARSLLCALLLAAAGCGEGGGEDATTGGATVDPGADPDGDRLTNAEEAKRGTDPAEADTDGDGYLDGDEVTAGTDPLDDTSRIYEGGWPFQPDKDTIADPGFDGTPTIGAPIPRLVAYDQFGELVDLYDFALHGRPVVIDLSALWCGACKDLAAWLGGEPSDVFDGKPEYAGIPGRVAAGEISWITIVFEDAAGNAATPEHAIAWAEAFPNAKIAVLADDDRAMFDYLYPGSYPSLQVLDEDMTLRIYDRFDYAPALAFLAQ